MKEFYFGGLGEPCRFVLLLFCYCFVEDYSTATEREDILMWRN